MLFCNNSRNYENLLKNNTRIAKETHTSTLVAYGEPGGYTAMAKTVALPAAMGADLILSGEIAERGVIMPTHRGVYEPILRELTKSGFKFVEKRVK